MSEPEREVAKRLCQVRRWKELSQSELGKLVGLTRDQIANIESERVTLRFSDAVKIAAALHCNLGWLAEEIGPTHYYIPIDPDLLKKIPKRAPFLDGYMEFVRSVFQHKFKVELAYLFQDVVPRQSEVDEMAWRLERVGASFDDVIPKLGEDVNSILSLCPADLRRELYVKIQKIVRDFRLKHYEQMDAKWVKETTVGGRAEIVKDNLYKVSEPAIVAGMSSYVPSWVELKKQIAELTKERGVKSALARKLGVSRQVFGNWLSSDDQGAPNAELTLRLLEWVQVEEAKQTKSSGSVTAPPERQTRKRKSVHENPKSSPP